MILKKKKKNTQQTGNRKNNNNNNKSVSIKRNIIKAKCENPITNIIVYCERLETYPLRSVTGQELPLLSCLFNMVLDVLARITIQEK